jgi:hypothetical protein
MAITKISSAVISDGAITPDLVSDNFANTFATLANVTSTLTNYATASEVTSIASSLAPKISSVAIANSTYHVKDDTAVNIGGGYIVVTGTGFASGAQVLVDGVAATSTTYVNETTIRAQVPAKSAATYTIYVVNTDGGTAIRVNGLTYSGTPTWVTDSTLTSAAVDTAIAINLSATGASSYAVASGSTLPTGLTLSANGYLYGTVTGLVAETTYNFSIDAIDAENQESARSFSITITVTPVYKIYTTGYNGAGTLDRGNFTNYYTLGETDWSTAGERVVDATAVNGYNWYEAFIAYLKEDGALWFGGGLGGLRGNLTSSENYSAESGTVVSQMSPWLANNYVAVGSSGQGSWCVANTSGVYTMYTGYSGPAIIPLSMYDSAGEFPVSFNASDIVAINSRSDRSTIVLLDDGRVGSYYAPWQPAKYTSGFVTIKSNVTQIASTENFVLALDNTGALWAGYGYGNYGPFGAGASNLSYFNVLASNVAQVSAHGNHGYYIKTDGTLWAWGTNYQGESGQLGPNHFGVGIVSSPTQVGTDTDWEKVTAGWATGYLKKTGSNQLYALGYSAYDVTFSFAGNPSGFPLEYTGGAYDPIFSNETSIPKAVYANSSNINPVAVYNDRKFKSGRSFTVVLAKA